MLLKKACFSLFIALALLSCKKEPFVPNSANALPGLWKQLGDFAGPGRVRAFGFKIGNKGYVLGGNAASGFNELLLNDFWEYDSAADKWTRKADYPGQASEYVRGFTINNKAYVGTGYGIRIPGPDTDVPQNNDFWEYDPATDKWTRKADFAGGKRENVIAFEINGVGYMGLGTNYDYSAAYKDIWKYSASADKWTRVADYPGLGSFGSVGFSANGKGYAGLGGAPPDVAAKDFWEYDPTANKWTQKADFKGSARAFSGQFVIGADGYAGMGSSVTATVDDWYKYDTAKDKWSKITNLPGVSRYDMVSFSINGEGYMGTGNPGLLKDFYKYTPNKTD
jgi:N-acetylneuraminic acid mutarotase